VSQRIPVVAALLALAVPGAVALGGCGAGESAATGAQLSTPAATAPQPQYEEQAVDKLQRNPTAVDPDAGVRTNFDPDAGANTTDPAKLAQPVSDAQIRRELEQSGIPSGGRAAVTPDGLAVAPLGAPDAVQAVISAGNQIARLPYRYGGGHATWSDTAYDCSASISFAFAAAGLLDRPLVSGDLAQWGEAGPGRWITIYANGGHVYMYVAGLRFDTSGLRATGSRWQADPRSGTGFTVRHPVGL
jgi:cell wall-associated NlpC family hydrolase